MILVSTKIYRLVNKYQELYSFGSLNGYQYLHKFDIYINVTILHYVSILQTINN